MNYLLESTVCITIFYGLYYLIFRRLTFVRLNRIYLLLSLVIGLSLPLISYQIKEIVKIPASVEYEEISSLPVLMNSSTPLLSNTPIVEPFDWNIVFQGIYILGILFMLMKFSIIVYKLLKIKRVSNGKEFISTQSQYANSSFFKLIFIDDSNLSAFEINQILEHEKWHIRLFHSYDLLFVEILKIIFWFNPILWLYQRSLSEVHEYEVDTRMIQTYNPQTYAQLLLKLATSNSQLATTHQFSSKPLTDRIHFLFTKQKSVPMKRLAYLSVLPILGAFFMAFSVEKVVDYQEVEESSKYFKIVRGSNDNVFSNVRIENKKIASTLYLNKDRIALVISENNISKELLNEAEKYFKIYGFILNHVHNINTVESLGVDNKVVPLLLNNIEIDVIENKENKIKRLKSERSKKSLFQVSYPFQLRTINGSIRDSTSIFKIIANKNDGSHKFSLLLPPPKPPLPPPPPPVPPKVGLKKPQNQNSIIPVYADKEINKYGGGTFMLLSNHKSKLIFAGRNIKKGTFLSETVTQKDWKIFLDYINNDDYFSEKFRKDMIPDYWDKIKVISEKIPVGFVAWNQAEEYCKWQSEMFSFNPQNIDYPNYRQILSSNAKAKLAFKCRLPTEKEWKLLMKKSSGNSGFRYIFETLSI
jgi:hypothetical protein